MSSVQGLQDDHDAFRATLDALESALGMASDTRFVVRELSFRLLLRLRDHAQREADLLASCHAPLSARELVTLADGHGDELRVLQDALWEMTGSSARDAVARVQRRLSLVLTQMRSHMAEQEYKLYPALGWVLKAREDEVPMNRIARWW